jgi:hypothetical protein
LRVGRAGDPGAANHGAAQKRAGSR